MPSKEDSQDVISEINKILLDQNFKEVQQIFSNAELGEGITKPQNQNFLGYDAEVEDSKDSHERGERTKIITSLFGNYRDQQAERYEYKKEKKGSILRFLVFLIIGIFALLCYCCYTVVSRNSYKTEDIVALVSSFVTCLGSILSILMIIIKYIFPEDEDKNFNNLVTAIIENDTKRTKDDKEYRVHKKSHQDGWN